MDGTYARILALDEAIDTSLDSDEADLLMEERRVCLRSFRNVDADTPMSLAVALKFIHREIKTIIQDDQADYRVVGIHHVVKRMLRDVQRIPTAVVAPIPREPKKRPREVVRATIPTAEIQELD